MQHPSTEANQAPSAKRSREEDGDQDAASGAQESKYFFNLTDPSSNFVTARTLAEMFTTIAALLPYEQYSNCLAIKVLTQSELGNPALYDHKYHLPFAIERAWYNETGAIRAFQVGGKVYETSKYLELFYARHNGYTHYTKVGEQRLFVPGFVKTEKYLVTENRNLALEHYTAEANNLSSLVIKFISDRVQPCNTDSVLNLIVSLNQILTISQPDTLRKITEYFAKRESETTLLTDLLKFSGDTLPSSETKINTFISTLLVFVSSTGTESDKWETFFKVATHFKEKLGVLQTAATTMRLRLPAKMGRMANFYFKGEALETKAITALDDSDLVILMTNVASGANVLNFVQHPEPEVYVLPHDATHLTRSNPKRRAVDVGETKSLEEFGIATVKGDTLKSTIGLFMMQAPSEDIVQSVDLDVEVEDLF